MPALRPASTLVLLAVLAAVLLWMPIPGEGSRDGPWRDLAHIPLAGGLALAVLWALRRRLPTADFAARTAAWLVATLFLAALEATQAFVGRTASLNDVLANGLGAAGFLALGAALERGPGRSRRFVALAVAAALLLVAAAPSLLRIADSFLQRREMPMLASFEHGLEMTRWVFKESRGRRVADHATHGDRSLRVTLEPGRWPGATLASGSSDWRGYTALTLDLHLDAGAPLELILKVEDAAHDGTYADRFHATLELESGSRHVHIALDDVRAAPRDREMDLGEIVALQLFVNGLDEERVLHVDAIRLVP